VTTTRYEPGASALIVLVVHAVVVNIVAPVAVFTSFQVTAKPSPAEQAEKAAWKVPVVLVVKVYSSWDAVVSRLPAPADGTPLLTETGSDTLKT